MQEEQCKTSPKTSNRQIHIFSMKKFCCESSFDEQLTKIHGEDFNSLQLFLILGKGNEMLLKTKPKQAFRKIYTCISRATFDKDSQRRLQTTPYSKPQKDEKRLFIAHNI